MGMSRRVGVLFDWKGSIKGDQMESRTPVKMIDGCPTESRKMGNFPIKNNTGGLQIHPVHSIVTDLQTPVQSSAPKGVKWLRA
jgi:hypothetical protein